MDQLKQLYAERRAAGGSQRNLAVSWSQQPFFAVLFVECADPLTACLDVACNANSPLQFDRQSSIRYSSRRARTLESLASLYEVGCRVFAEFLVCDASNIQKFWLIIDNF